MDASQYKDYVLSFLFIKYISDKYTGQPYAPIKIPRGASFADMVALKGKPDIGDQINKKVIGPLAKANEQLSQADFPDFNASEKLGDGKEKVERLTNLIAIFENPALNFSKNRAEGDDICRASRPFASNTSLFTNSRTLSRSTTTTSFFRSWTNACRNGGRIATN